MDTLQLLNDVARHLSKARVEVLIQKPESPHANGETWVEENWWVEFPVKIAVDPDIVWNGSKYLSTFLHEVAHAKLHVAKYEVGGIPFFAGIKAENFDGLFEIEARALGNRWVQFAEWHKGEFPVNRAVNRATADFQSKLLALLNSAYAAEME